MEDGASAATDCHCCSPGKLSTRICVRPHHEQKAEERRAFLAAPMAECTVNDLRKLTAPMQLRCRARRGGIISCARVWRAAAPLSKPAVVSAPSGSRTRLRALDKGTAFGALARDQKKKAPLFLYSATYTRNASQARRRCRWRACSLFRVCARGGLQLVRNAQGMV